MTAKTNIEWQGKSRGGLWGYKFFIFILRNFGLSFTYFFLRFVTFYYFLFSRKSSKAIFYYFRHILHYGAIKSFFKIYRSYVLLGEIMIDKVASLCGLNHYFSYVFEGEDSLKEIIDGQKGGILIGGHVGNWEISSHRLNRFKGKINLLMLDAEHRKLSSLLSGIKVHYPDNVNMIVVKDDLSHIYEVSRALQNNEIVCIHGDRFIKDNKTEKISFMGKDALFSIGPFILAAKFKVPVCYFYGMKESKKKYHLYAFLSKVNTNKYTNSLPSEILREYVANLEYINRKYPDQWFNYYKFWGEQAS